MLNHGDDSMTEISATTIEPTQTSTDRYVIDGRSSRFTVRAFADGFLAAMGHNPTIGILEFSGEMKFNPDKLEAGSLKIIDQIIFIKCSG